MARGSVVVVSISQEETSQLAEARSRPVSYTHLDVYKRQVPGVRNDLLAVVPKDGRIELVIQAANYHMNGSGIFYSLLIGRDTVLSHHIFWQRMLIAFALGGILFIGIYHLFLFAFRRREKIYLIYSVTCLVTTVRLAMESNNLFQYFLPGGIGPVLNRVFLLLFTLQNLCICIFMPVSYTHLP